MDKSEEDDFEFRSEARLEGVRAFSIAPVAQKSFEYLGFKWGPSAYGFAGGTVSWSFATSATMIAMTENEYRQEVQGAFARWEAVADIQFNQLPDGANADIVIGWAVIDGVSGPILGQARWSQFPTGGELDRASGVLIEMDVAEYNRAAGNAAVQASSFEMVVAHEIGHAIGLDHDADPAALLHGTLPGLASYANFGLNASDIAAIQILYGAAAGAVVRGAAGTDGNDVLDYGANAVSVLVFAGAGNDAVTTGQGPDTVFGGPGNDTITANGGTDTVFGSFGDDTINGGDASDFLGDSAGRNRLVGGNGHDTLHGGTGDDRLVGGAGNDVLVADGYGGGFLFGDDTLEGGAGNDTLFGGFGRDTFVFAPGDGSDVIRAVSGTGGAATFAGSARDFEVGTDILDMRAFGLSSAAGAAAVSVIGSGGNTVVTLAGVSITLTGVDVSHFSFGDFLWV